MTTIGGSAGRSAIEERLEAFRARAQLRRQRRVRANLSTLLLFVDLFMASMVAVNLHGPVRVFGGLLFCLTVPGWSIVGPLRRNRAPRELALSMAAGLCALMVVAQLAVTLGFWHLTFFQLVVCVLCLPSLLWQSLERRWPPEASR